MINDTYFSIFWNILLSIISLLNIFKLKQILLNKKSFFKNTYCCIIFTLVCSFRSVLPRVDAERLCFWDLGNMQIIHSPFIGRFCATFAEIAFSYQITKLWQMIVTNYSNKYFNTAKICWVLCCFAQILCWIGVITTNHIFHAFETSLWGLSSLILTVNTCIILSKIPNKNNSDILILKIFTLLCLFFSIYIFTIDVPMYIEKWILNGKGIYSLTLNEGFHDSFTCKVNKSFELWSKEMIWMTPYFLIGPYISLKIEEYYDSKILIKKS